MKPQQTATKVVLASVILLTVLGVCSPVAAKPQPTVACDQRYMHTCWDAWKFEPKKVKPFRADRRHIPRRSGRAVHAPQRPAYASRPAAPQRAAERAEGHGKTLHGVIAPLAEKAEQIVRTCGSWIMSAVRHTQVAGSGRLSCHAVGKAVDIAGNPSCIYSLLKGWRGGYSTDYSRVRCRGRPCPHVHVSLGCSEDGKRFVHPGTARRGKTI